MELFKKGQGLSLTTIIIAILAIIVLVVLVVIFTGRMGVFEKESSQAGGTELVKLKIYYGDCHPTLVKEATFRLGMGKATTELDKAKERDAFKKEIDSCKSYTSKTTCDGGGCSWK